MSGEAATERNKYGSRKSKLRGNDDVFVHERAYF